MAFQSVEGAVGTENIQRPAATGFSSEMIHTQKQKVQHCAPKNLKRLRKQITLLSEN